MYNALALSTGQELPFVTIDNWESYADDARAICKASFLHYFPLLRSEAEIEAWNAYSASNYGWMENGRHHLNNGVTVNLTDDSRFPFVFKLGDNGPEKADMSEGPVSPLWQYGPLPLDRGVFSTNMDGAINPNFKNIRDVTLQTKQASLSAQSFIPGLESNAPDSMLVQPIFSGFEYETNRTIVAHLVAVIPWEEFFSNVRRSCIENAVDVHSQAFPLSRF